MANVRICIDPAECRAAWKQSWPKECLFDLWEVRESFAAGYKRQPHFLIAEEGNEIVGLLPLSWVEANR